jgi:hypothetical protein
VSNDLVAQTIDHELELIRSAVAMVASGKAPRVVVGSLRFGEQIMDQAQELAGRNGLQATAQWTLDKHQHAIAIEHRDG